MNWILIGIIGGSLIVSSHDSREACEGRAAILREQKAAVKCVDVPTYNSNSGLIYMYPNAQSNTR